MVLPQLLWRFARHRDDGEFYRLQAEDAIRWMVQQGVRPGPETEVLDLGCGHGVFGGELSARGCRVTYADAENFLWPPHETGRFLKIDLDREPLARLGAFDLVVCSNVLEHLAHPRQFLDQASALLRDRGLLYLSWTNWLSPWGGHEFSPFHYLGPGLGPRVYDRLSGKPRFHQPYSNLFPTHIGRVLGWIREGGTLELLEMAPRYYTEFSFVMRIPMVREFAAWNCAMLIRKKGEGGTRSVSP